MKTMIEQIQRIPGIIHEERQALIVLDQEIDNRKRVIKDQELSVEDIVQADKNLKNENQRNITRASLLGDMDEHQEALKALAVLEAGKRSALANIELQYNTLKVFELSQACEVAE